MGGKKKFDRYDFIWKAIQKHGYKYDYREVNYVNYSTNVKIICPIHGEFWSTPNNHLCGYGCKKCGIVNGHKKQIKPFSIFKAEANELHNFKYEYDESTYVDTKTKIKMICPIHGEFWLSPNTHLSGHGCQKCSVEHVASLKRKNTYDFIENGERIYKDENGNPFFNYSKSNNINNTRDSTIVICPIHGEFETTYFEHIYKKVGCKKCNTEKLDKYYEENRKINKEKFINKAKSIFKDENSNPLYIYDKVEYKDAFTQVCIICPKHGEFWQIPTNHLSGHGCQKCKYSLLEKDIDEYLKNRNIKFITQKKFEWLKYKDYLFLDFYLPEYNIGIECQGLQHFKPIKWYGGDEVFEKTIKRDEIKRKLCEENGVKLLYYSNLGIEYPYEVFEDKDELLKEILNTNVRY